MFSWTFFHIIFSYVFMVFILIFSSLMMITQSPIFSGFYLVLVFFSSAGFLMLINFSYLGLVILIVYLGALIVLFLFIVMLLNIKVLEMMRKINFFPFLFGFLAFFFFFSLGFNNFKNFSEIFINFSNIFESSWSTLFFKTEIFDFLGISLYVYNNFILILLGFVLLLAMIGSIFLTLNIKKKFRKQLNFLQLLRNRVITLNLINSKIFSNNSVFKSVDKILYKNL